MNQRQRKKLSRRLFAVLWTGDAARLRALLRAGADPGWADRDGTTLLYEASVNGQAEAVRLLLAAGAAPDVESEGPPGADGTPLCAAACWGHTETVRALLEYGADPDLREDAGTGWSPLDWARHGSHTDTAALLTAAGATATRAGAGGTAT